MSNSEDQAPTPAVELSMRVAASAGTVWRMIATASGFSEWMEGRVSFEPRAGSGFRAEFAAFGIVLGGEIVELDPGARRLALTWGIESGPDAQVFPAGSSLVEFRVRPDGPACRIELRHTGLRSAEAAALQESGWRFQLGKLDLKANRADLAAGLDRTLPEWIAAWNERDPEMRMAALKRCCRDDVAFRDEWAALSGTAPLSAHIGSCHQYMPGYTLEHTGDVRICRGEALVGWRASGPGGEPTEGFNHLRADPDGTIRRVTGFRTARSNPPPDSSPRPSAERRS